MRERILILRKTLSLSQNKLAEDIGLSRTFINLYENGNRELSDRTISDICRVYNVNEEWLRTGEGEMFKPLDREAEIAILVKDMLKEEEDSFKSKLIKVINGLNEEQLEVLQDICNKLANNNSPC